MAASELAHAVTREPSALVEEDAENEGNQERRDKAEKRAHSFWFWPGLEVQLLFAIGEVLDGLLENRKMELLA